MFYVLRIVMICVDVLLGILLLISVHGQSYETSMMLAYCELGICGGQALLSMVYIYLSIRKKEIIRFGVCHLAVMVIFAGLIDYGIFAPKIWIG